MSEKIDQLVLYISGSYVPHFKILHQGDETKHDLFHYHDDTLLCGHTNKGGLKVSKLKEAISVVPII